MAVVRDKAGVRWVSMATGTTMGWTRSKDRGGSVAGTAVRIKTMV